MIARAHPEISDEELLEAMSVVRSVVRQHKQSERWAIGLRRMGLDEAHSVGAEALVEARRDYHSGAREDSTFAGFARFVVQRRLRAAICKYARFPVSLERGEFIPGMGENDLAASFAGLGSDDRELLGAFYGYGTTRESPDTIALRMGLSTSTVRRRVAGAIERLRELMV